MPTVENHTQLTVANTLHELRSRARALASSPERKAPPKLAVVAAEDDIALSAAAAALALGIAIPILIGHEKRLRFKAAEIGLSEALDGAEIASACDAQEATKVAVN